MITVTSPQRLWVEVRSPSSPDDSATGSALDGELPAKASTDKGSAEGQRLEPPRVAGEPVASPMHSGRSGAGRSPRPASPPRSKYAVEAAELSAMVRLRAQAALVGKVAGLPEEATATLPTTAPAAPDVAAAVRLLCYKSVLGGDGSEVADPSSGRCTVASATG